MSQKVSPFLRSTKKHLADLKAFCVALDKTSKLIPECYRFMFEAILGMFEHEVKEKLSEVSNEKVSS